MEDRAFRGIWFPKDIWFDDRLNALEKIILLEIDSLDNENGCYASNEHLANFCHCSTRKVSDSITTLKELGYIEIVSFNGRVRVIKSCLAKNASLPSKNCESATQNLLQRNNNIDNNNIDKKDIDKSISKKEIDFNEIKTLYESICGSLPKLRCLSEKRKRNIKKFFKEGYTLEDFKKVCEKVEKSDFMTGRSGGHWKTNFDWIINPDNANKILEGNYDNNNKSKAESNTQYCQPIPQEDDALKEIFGIKE